MPATVHHFRPRPRELPAPLDDGDLDDLAFVRAVVIASVFGLAIYGGLGWVAYRLLL